MVKTSEYIKKNYSEIQKPIINKLKILNKELEGELNLKEFTNLEILQCSYNRLNVDTLSSELLGLDLRHSELRLDLNKFSRLKNLFSLKLGGNEITGSLEALKDIKNLAWLDIENTQIDRGLKYLKNTRLSKNSSNWVHNWSTPFYCENTIFHPILRAYEYNLSEFFTDVEKKVESLQKGNDYWKKYSQEELVNKIIDIYEEAQRSNLDYEKSKEVIDNEKEELPIKFSKNCNKFKRSLWEKVRKSLLKEEKQKLENNNLSEKKIDKILNTRNILLIGKTGNGKSTLANVLLNKNGNFEEVFKESEFAVSETKETQIECFEEDGIKYQIVDTIGIGDTQLTTHEVLERIADTIYLIGDNLNQILFVTSGRFTEREIEIFNMLKEIMFDKKIVNYTTIVRTKFPAFRKSEKCKDDKEKLLRENENVSEVINSSRKLIHVNNMNKEEESNLKSRIDSRLILLTHLRNCRDDYKITNFDALNERVSNFMTEEERMEKEREEADRKLRRQQEENEKRLREAEEEKKRKLQEIEERKRKEKKEMEEVRQRELREFQERREREKREEQQREEQRRREERRRMIELEQERMRNEMLMEEMRRERELERRRQEQERQVRELEEERERVRMEYEALIEEMRRWR